MGTAPLLSFPFPSLLVFANNIVKWIGLRRSCRFPSCFHSRAIHDPLLHAHPHALRLGLITIYSVDCGLRCFWKSMFPSQVPQLTAAPSLAKQKTNDRCLNSCTSRPTLRATQASFGCSTLCGLISSTFFCGLFLPLEWQCTGYVRETTRASIPDERLFRYTLIRLQMIYNGSEIGDVEESEWTRRSIKRPKIMRKTVPYWYLLSPIMMPTKEGWSVWVSVYTIIISA